MAREQYFDVDYSKRSTNVAGTNAEELFVAALNDKGFKARRVADDADIGKLKGIDVLAEKNGRDWSFDVKNCKDSIKDWGNVTIELYCDVANNELGWYYNAEVDFYVFRDATTGYFYIVARDDFHKFFDKYKSKYRYQNYRDSNKTRGIVYTSLEDMCEHCRVTCIADKGELINNYKVKFMGRYRGVVSK